MQRTSVAPPDRVRVRSQSTPSPATTVGTAAAAAGGSDAITSAVSTGRKNVVGRAKAGAKHRFRERMIIVLIPVAMHPVACPFGRVMIKARSD